jgi:carbonyl reductase 1
LNKLEKLGLKAKFHQLDIGDRGSIDRLAKFVRETYGGLDVLVNNAAILLDFVIDLTEF